MSAVRIRAVRRRRRHRRGRNGRLLSFAAPYGATVVLPALAAACLLVFTSDPSGPQHGKHEPGTVSIAASFLLAMAAIVLLSRALGAALGRIGQPPVIGEILAGICIGPSVLGLVAPSASDALFPPAIMPYLDTLAQLGLVLYMFGVGVELDLSRLRDHGGVSVIVGHAGIMVPGVLGIVLAVPLYPELAGEDVGLPAFALFLALAMGMTAFPVLARILRDRGLQHSRLGVTALGGAAVADLTAWCLLAVVVSLAGAGPGHAMRTVTLSAAFAVVTWFVVRPLLTRLVARHEQGGVSGTMLLVVLVSGALLSAFVTEWIGIHTILGAFLFGAVVPKDSPALRALTGRLETFTLAFLMPAFFAQLGLKVDIGLLGGNGGLWLLCGIVVALATLGKLTAATAGARLAGRPWRESGALGALLNCRGMTELVVLTVGLRLGVLTPALFTIFVVMAVVTTVATGPLLDLFLSNREDRDETWISAGATSSTR